MMIKKRLLLSFLAVLSCGLMAFSNVANAERGNFYLGASAGAMQMDIEGADDPVNAGVVFGYHFASNFMVEGELTTTTSKGEYTRYYGNFKYTSDISIHTLGVYGAYRAYVSDSAYFKLRAGLLAESVEIGSKDSSDAGVSGGVALGFDFDAGQIEVGYTFVERDANYVGVTLSFDL